ncbi:MAG: peptidyl-prolyl cis-trans isomerase [Candidatus Omnitrophica bacterium]|nr:peptidyl-prolyl cis-trans isomerase [Candidatus Omnitrophota bacterium]
MRKNNFLILLAAGMFLVISLVASGAFAEDVESKGGNDYVVASIGEEKIYFSEIERVAKGLNRYYRENFDTSRDWRLSYVRQYVVRVALAKRAEREGIHKDKDVIFEIERARENILSDKVLSTRLAGIKITEEDLQKYYLQNRERYQIKEKLKLSYIKVKNKKQAEKIIAALNKGRSFETVAKKRMVKLDNWISQDTPLVSQLEGLSSQALNELFSLGIGGSSNPVEVKDEFYIFHIDEKEPAKDRPFDEVRRQVEGECTQKAKEKAIAELIRETFARENVEVYEDRVTEHMPQ